MSNIKPFVGDRRVQPRFKARRSVRMFDALSPATRQPGILPVLPMVGHTLDISETGLAIVVTSDSPGSQCNELVGRELRIVLDLPDGLTDVRCTVVRVRPLVEEGEEGYLIGARITQMNDKDWVHMIRYILKLRERD